MHTDAAGALEYLPAAQLEHMVFAVAPEALEYWPDKQLEQALAPKAEEYIPAPHEVHTTAGALEYVPAEHLEHVAIAVAPNALEYCPMEHCKQALAPKAEEYMPAPHGVHTAAGALANVPAEHWEHVAIAVAPNALEYCPMEQPKQATALKKKENEPA